MAAFLCAAFFSGCIASQPYVSRERLQRGLVIVLPGIEGRSGFNEAICRGLNDGGVNWAIELYDWTFVLFGPLYNLRNEQGNREKAEWVADRIVRYQVSYPDRPVILVGQSGGGAIAAWVAEALPGGTGIDGIIMLAVSMSPNYMLDDALAKTRLGIISFYSSRDWFLLGLGTTISGTMDGEHTSSAGRIGFELPSEPRRAKTYEKLLEVPWFEKMAKTGHAGGHLTSGAGRFVRRYVAPFVRANRWDQQQVARVLRGEKVDVVPPRPLLRWKPMPQSTTAPTH
ncbi:MAG: hypothetical protein SVT52_07075 [Planctomycetota bacterium]|nr:hypothetical protein [Planctomycetota bacterium]